MIRQHNTQAFRSAGVFAIGLLLVALGIPLTATAAPEDKVTICHSGEGSGSNNNATLTISYQAVYGNNGHLNLDGSGATGHTHDYLGTCIDTSTTTSPAPTTTLAPATTSTLAPTTTSTTVAPTTTSTLAPTTTSTTVAPTTTSTSAPTPPLSAPITVTGEPTSTTLGVGVGGVDLSTGPSTSIAASAPTSTYTTVETADLVVDVLPFTGASFYLVIPGVVLMLIGAIAVLTTTKWAEALSKGRHAS